MSLLPQLRGGGGGSWQVSAAGENEVSPSIEYGCKHPPDFGPRGREGVSHPGLQTAASWSEEDSCSWDPCHTPARAQVHDVSAPGH